MIALHCEGPNCDAWVGQGSLEMNAGFLTIKYFESFQHFCGWKCLAKYAAEQPWAETIDIEPPVE